MNYFLTNIKVNKIFHLQDFDIRVSAEEKKHLIITGKNGSGKTVLLNAILTYLDRIKTDPSLNFLNYRQYKADIENQINSSKWFAGKEQILLKLENRLKSYTDSLEEYFGKVELSFNNLVELSKAYHEGDFILAFYEAHRKSEMVSLASPVKPDYNPGGSIRDKKIGEFLKFLVDYKIQEALARNESQLEDADKIAAWFADFERLLQEIFEDKALSLKFNYKDYSFTIVSNGKEFMFTELSDGYSAVIDVVTDLIFKMQSPTSLTRAYEKQGIVLIDEIETHLHLGLQRVILPMLTRIFPNIQFIVTTHSPFILSSLNNAVAFDLEQRCSIDDLTDYSYEALAEGYFGVRTESSDIQIRLERFRELAFKEVLAEKDKVERDNLIADFEKIPEAVAPNVIAEFLAIKRQMK